MKKLWHDAHYKLIRGKLAKRSLQRQLRFKDYTRRRRQAYIGMPKPERTARNEFKHLPIVATFLTAPRLMCFLRNPNEMSKFISTLQDCMKARRPVFVELKQVEELELNAITVLLSVMVHFKSLGIKFNGDKPANAAAARILHESQFFAHLQGTYQERDAYDFAGLTIYTHGKLAVDAEFSQGLIEKASEAVWGEKRRCTGLQRTFIELMQNTNNHASLDSPGEEHWWISVQH